MAAEGKGTRRKNFKLCSRESRWRAVQNLPVGAQPHVEDYFAAVKLKFRAVEQFLVSQRVVSLRLIQGLSVSLSLSLSLSG